MRLVLASESPRRRALLEQIGLAPDEICSADIDETPHPKETARLLSLRLAEAKARAVATPGAVTLAADTVVSVGRRLLGKATDEAEARVFLALLSGRNHRVTTGMCVLCDDAVRLRVSETRVTMKRLSARDIDDYIRLGEWQGKAGGYAIQGRAARFIQSLNGSYSGVVGLDLFSAAHLLESFGVRPR